MREGRGGAGLQGGGCTQRGTGMRVEYQKAGNKLATGQETTTMVLHHNGTAKTAAQ